MILNKNDIKLFAMTAQLIFGLVKEEELDDFLFDYQYEQMKVEKKTHDKTR